MKLLFQLVLPLILLGASAKEVFAKDWRGLFPLRSTRADVIRRFNQCLDSASTCRFSYEKSDVYIVFSSGSDRVDECEKSLPMDTILLIEVKPTITLRLSDLQIDRKKLRIFDPATPRGQGYKVGYKAYIDESIGIVINTFKGKVLQLDYIASSENRHVCPTYYEDPESFVAFGLFYHPAPVSVDCPTSKVRAGDKISVSAHSASETKVRYSWTLTAGRIIKGHRSRTILIDTSGIEGQVITVTVEVKDQSSHTQTSSCTLQVLPNQ
jgi:hypothetical protein